MLQQSTHKIIDAQSGNAKSLLYKEKLLNIFDDKVQDMNHLC